MRMAGAYLRGELTLDELAARMTGEEPYEIRDGRLRWKRTGDAGTNSAQDRSAQPPGPARRPLDVDLDAVRERIGRLRPELLGWFDQCRAAIERLHFTPCQRRARCERLVAEIDRLMGGRNMAP